MGSEMCIRDSYYTQQHNEAYDAIEKIHPFLKTEASEYAINIWFTALNAAYNLGRYEILKYSEEIIETLKACQDNKAVYSQVNACYAFLGALFFNTGHVDTALYFYDLSDKCATQHGHVRMLAYNKLNRLSLNLTGLSLIHISEPTRRTPISYAVFCLKNKN